MHSAARPGPDGRLESGRMNDAIRSLGNARRRGLYLLLAVAIAAGAAGGALDRLWVAREGGIVGWRSTSGEGGAVLVNRPAERLTEAQRAERPLGERRRLMNPGEDGIPYALRAVDLTNEQRGRIVALAEKYRPVADSLMRSVAPRVRQLDLQMREEAMCVLTPKQRDDWVAWRKREGMNMDEAGEMLRLVTAGQCPADATRK
jgi:Spy/CpxP family protein refolding chaperone